MFRKMVSTFAAVLLALPFSFAQDLPQEGHPKLPSSGLGPQLILWSQGQQPQPIPEAIPHSNPPEKLPSDTASCPTAQLFVGTIVSERGRLVLRQANNVWYQIHDQQKAKRFEGKAVRLNGRLDSQGRNIYVVRIDDAL